MLLMFDSIAVVFDVAGTMLEAVQPPMLVWFDTVDTVETVVTVPDRTVTRISAEIPFA